MKRNLSITLLFGFIALLVNISANAQSADNDTLDLTGDWTLTTGFGPGLEIDNTPAHHWVPAGAKTVYEVHIDLVGPTAHGKKYIGYYKNIGGTHPLGQPGALVAETYYANRGVVVVQIIEPSPDSFQYFLLRSGKHQRYPTDDPTRVEVLGGWTDIGGNIGNFSLVKISN